MNTITRRTFLKNSMVMAGAGVAFSQNVLGANEKIIFGCMGLGGRGSYLANAFSRRSDVEVAWVCDPYLSRAKAGAAMVEKNQGRPPKVSQDFRKILDDSSVQVLVNATPDHWHVLPSVWACQAGKDVYVEKPMSHNLWEGRQLLEASRKHQRIVQVGMQSRSAPYMKLAVDYIRSGAMGKIHLVRVFNMMQHSPRSPAPDQEPPADLDYEIWTGPAAKLPYNPNRYWLNHFEYSCGPIPGDAVHQLDLARMLLGDKQAPRHITHQGGIVSLKDGRDTPDTQLATFDYGDVTLLFESSLWSPYMKKIAQHIRDGDLFPEWQFCATRIEVLGENGFMYVGRHGGGWQAYDRDGKLARSEYGRQGDQPHQDNFLNAIRTRGKANADAEQGHYTAMLCHLANAAFRSGHRHLEFDGQKEQFVNSPEANKLLRRQYRQPWVLEQKA